MIDLKNNTIDLELFHTILKEIKNRPEHAIDLMDSVGKNQFRSKGKLLELVDKLELTQDYEVVIFGCWYGSILIPALYTKFKQITGIDVDSKVVTHAQYNLFQHYKNVGFVIGDVFSVDLAQYSHDNLMINTSCEHMPPMKEWPFWDRLSSNSYFAFQSNNMDKIDGHTNCVNSLEEFKYQLPDNFVVLFEDEFSDDRGVRYTLVGQIQQHSV